MVATSFGHLIMQQVPHVTFLVHSPLISFDENSAGDQNEMPCENTDHVADTGNRTVGRSINDLHKVIRRWCPTCLPALPMTSPPHEPTRTSVNGI